MIKTVVRWFVGKSVSAMQKKLDYDASYLLDVADASSGGAMRLGLLPMLSQYHAGASASLWAGVALASTRDGDCGPCLQLVVNTALSKHVDATEIRAALEKNFEAAGEVGLGYRFGVAAITDGPQLDILREELLAQYGQEAVSSLSIAAATCRSWPVIKRGLGYGRVCQAVVVEEVQINLTAVA